MPKRRTVLPAILAGTLLSILAISRVGCADVWKPLPVPDADAQRRAMQLVSSVFKDQFDKAGDGNGKRVLAQKLIGVAADTDEPAERYVLLRVSRDIAAGAGDAATALAAIETMATLYEVDRTPMQTAALLQAAKVKLPPQPQAQLIQTVLQAADEAVARDDYASAGRLLPAALAAARRGKAAQQVRQVIRRTRQVADLQKRFDEFGKARGVLETNPQDADANLVVGRYLCLVKGSWDRGLPYLALGSDPALKAAATAELATVETAEGEIQLGDAWWDLSEAAGGDDADGLDQRRPYQLRAAHWYAHAVGRLPGGLARLKIQKRLEEIAASDPLEGTHTVPGTQDTSPAIAPPRGALQVLYKCEDRNATDNQIRLHLKIANTGQQRVPLSDLTVRYWYTSEGGKPQRHWCDWAQLGAGNVRGSFHRMKKPLKLADTYLEIGFADAAPPVPPGGDSGVIQLRLANSDWSGFDESNDYSFDPQHTELAPAPRVTLYQQGVLVWGTEPSDTRRGRP